MGNSFYGSRSGGTTVLRGFLGNEELKGSTVIKLPFRGSSKVIRPLLVNFWSTTATVATKGSSWLYGSTTWSYFFCGSRYCGTKLVEEKKVIVTSLPVVAKLF